jgi:hypothetical protein
MSTLPPYATHELISERLPLIFSAGTPNRNTITNEVSASVIFTMIYIGATEGNGIYLKPMDVYRMTEEHSQLSDNASRSKYHQESKKKNFAPAGERWYADNTRESIRDEAIREGLVTVGAVLQLSGIPTTSSKPRYFLQSDFAALFDPTLAGGELENQITKWRNNNLSKSALTRISLANEGIKASNEKILITFPNKETRQLSPGLSSIISKEVIETFSVNFLESPVVLWLSTSADKVVAKDEKLAAKIGLNIQADKDLPDIILVDLGPNDPLIIFIEVVATDGPISERRQQAVYDLTDAAKFDRKQVLFVTAYMDRDFAEVRKTMGRLAWNTFAWFVSEPDKIVILRDGTEKLSKLISLTDSK